MTEQEVRIFIVEQGQVLKLILSLAGFLFITLFGIVGYFIRRLVAKQDKDSLLIGNLVGQMNVIEKINETKLENLTDNVNKLAVSLQDHTKAIDERMHQKDRTNELLIDLIGKMSKNESKGN